MLAFHQEGTHFDFDTWIDFEVVYINLPLRGHPPKLTSKPVVHSTSSKIQSDTPS